MVMQLDFQEIAWSYDLPVASVNVQASPGNRIQEKGAVSGQKSCARDLLS